MPDIFIDVVFIVIHFAAVGGRPGQVTDLGDAWLAQGVKLAGFDDEVAAAGAAALAFR